MQVPRRALTNFNTAGIFVGTMMPSAAVDMVMALRQFVSVVPLNRLPNGVGMSDAWRRDRNGQQDYCVQ